MRDVLTAEKLRQLLNYDAETGVFTWRVRASIRAKPGAPAGTVDNRGYIRIGVAGGIYRAHRLAILYVTGEWPAEEVDHLDGDKANNRYANLRDVSRALNQQNMRLPYRSGKSGYLGVSLHRPTGKWRARVSIGRRAQSLGLYDTPDAAHAAYVAAKRQLHPGCSL